MDKKSANGKNSLEKRRRQRISMSLLFSYLLILLAPAVAIVVVYLTASRAFEESQTERIQSMLSEARLTFDREIQQAQNVGRYVSSERRLTDHLGLGYRPGRSDEFYAVYTIASNYPNYSLTNSIIKDVYVLISESRYIIKIPQVIPETRYGVATLSDFPFSSYETFMDYYNEQDKSAVLFTYKKENGEEILFLPCQMKYPYSWPGKSAVIVELNWKRVREILELTLGEQEGITALLDEHGQILTGLRLDSEGHRASMEGEAWEEVLKQNGYGGQSAAVCSKYSVYNGWSLVTAVPQRVLTQRIGTVRYMVVGLCALSVLIGLFICFAYWSRRKVMVEKYFLLQEQMGISEDKVRFWGTFGGFLRDVSRMWDALKEQKELLRGEFLRRLFYGGYDSPERLLEDAKRTDISVEAAWFYVASIELSDPLGSDFKGTREEFGRIFREYLAGYLTWEHYVYQISELSGAVLIMSGTPAAGELKEALGQLSGVLYDKFKVTSYIGLSCGCEDVMKVDHEYEIALRLGEFARCFERPAPVDSADLPGEQGAAPEFLTIDTELKLLKLLQGGDARELEALLSRIEELYFRPGSSGHVRQHALETLKSCIYRSVSSWGNAAEAAGLREAARKAGSPEEIFGLLREARESCERRARERREEAPSFDRNRAAAFIEENYPDSGLNLSILAEWLGMPERKLYGEFKTGFGMTFSAYLEKRRIECACALLKEGTSVGETARLSGYGSDYSFRRAFKRVIGISPSDFQKIGTNKKNREKE